MLPTWPSWLQIAQLGVVVDISIIAWVYQKSFEVGGTSVWVYPQKEQFYQREIEDSPPHIEASEPFPFPNQDGVFKNPGAGYDMVMTWSRPGQDGDMKHTGPFVQFGPMAGMAAWPFSLGSFSMKASFFKDSTHTESL